MGDRALIIVTDPKGERISPTVYLHWGGGDVPSLLAELTTFMEGRRDDVEYCAARLIGLAHARNDRSNLSLGVWNAPAPIVGSVREVMAGDAIAAHALAEYSRGDAGVIVYNCTDGSWQAFGGYLKDAQNAEKAELSWRPFTANHLKGSESWRTFGSIKPPSSI